MRNILHNFKQISIDTQIEWRKATSGTVKKLKERELLF